MAYSVYVIELRPEAMEKKAFAGKNAGRREDKPCVYVGQTARTPEERFAQHLGTRSRPGATLPNERYEMDDMRFAE